MKVMFDKAELFPVYCESDADADRLVRIFMSASSLASVDMSEEELADFRRVFDAWEQWQRTIEQRIRLVAEDAAA